MTDPSGRGIDMRGHKAAVKLHFKPGKSMISDDALMIYFDSIEAREAWISGFTMSAQSGHAIAAIDSLHAGDKLYNAAVMIRGLVDSDELEEQENDHDRP